MRKASFIAIGLVVLLIGTAHAHFGMILPSDDVVSQSEGREVTLRLMFLHPFEVQLMQMERPRAFGVLVNGKKTDLLDRLKKEPLKGYTTWKAIYRLKHPGDHIFYLEPSPYWEPAEETFIIHYTKVIVNAFGLERGWDEEVGLPVEIVPLTRPYGLWAGNVFQGIVKVNGRPLPFAEVEVEYYNEHHGVKAPEPAFVTQVIKADSNGVFTYAMPRAGWWGFAALVKAPYTLKRDGKSYPVELGGVLWVRTREMR